MSARKTSEAVPGPARPGSGSTPLSIMCPSTHFALSMPGSFALWREKMLKSGSFSTRPFPKSNVQAQAQGLVWLSFSTHGVTNFSDAAAVSSRRATFPSPRNKTLGLF